MKKETVIIIVAIAVLGLLYYFFIYKKNQTTTTAATQTPGATAATPATLPPTTQAATVNGSPALNATATDASQTLTTTAQTVRPSTGINPVGVTAVDSSQFDPVILPWINSFGVANKQHALDMYPQFTADEKAMLVDFITNLWPGKRTQTAADTIGWNNWRTKYHILDGTYSPFSGDAQTAYAGMNAFDSGQDAYVAHDINPLQPVSGSQTANSFVIKGSGGEAVNNFKRGRKKK